MAFGCSKTKASVSMPDGLSWIRILKKASGISTFSSLGSPIVSFGVDGSKIGPAITQTLRYLFEAAAERSEEHTSELQSLMRISYAVFCLKKKNNINDRKQCTHT